MALVVPVLELAVIVIVGVSPALTRVNPALVITPVVNVSLPLEGFVGEAPDGALVAVQVQATA